MKKHSLVKAASLAAFAVAGSMAYGAYADSSPIVLTPSACAEEQENCTLEGGKLTINNGVEANLTISEADKVTSIVNNGKLTILGNGSIVSENDHAIVNNGALTVAAGTSLKFDAKKDDTSALFNNGTAYIYSGIFERSLEDGVDKSTHGTNSYYTIVNHGVMTVDGATVKNKGHYSSMFENGYFNYATDHNNSNAAEPTLTLISGTFDGGLNTIKNDDGAVINIKGGTFENFTQAVFQNHNVATISGGIFKGSKAEMVIHNHGCDSTYDKGNLTITGGEFEAPITTGLFILNNGSMGDIKISGGKFTNANFGDKDSANYAQSALPYVVTGYQPVEGPAGTLTLAPTPGTSVDKNAKVIDTTKEVDEPTMGATSEEMNALLAQIAGSEELAALLERAGTGAYNVVLSIDAKGDIEYTLPAGISESVKDEIEAYLGGLPGKVGVFDVNIVVKAGTEEMPVTELGDDITLTVQLPEYLQEPEEGYERKFYVVRIHKNTDGSYQVDKLDATQSADKSYIEFDNKLFSDAIVGFVDTKKAVVPKPAKGGFASFAGEEGTTSSNLSVVLALVAISIALTAGVIRIAKRHE